MKLVTLALVASLSTACTGSFGASGRSNTMHVNVAGPGPTIAVGVGLAILGGALTYKVNTDGSNPYGLDTIGNAVGVGMMVVGAGAMIYGGYELATEPAVTVTPAPIVVRSASR